MRHVLAALGTAGLVLMATPAVRASTGPRPAILSLGDQQVAFAKGGWHGGGKGWRHGLKRRGPPPWAPAWGRRRRHR